MARTKQTVCKSTGEKDYCNQLATKTAWKSVPITRGVKKSYRYHPGTVVLHKICHYYKSINLLIQKVL